MNQKTCAIVAALSSLASLASAGQYNIGFRHYTGYEDPADPLAGLSMCVDANETEGYVDFTFSLEGRGALPLLLACARASASALPDEEAAESFADPPAFASLLPLLAPPLLPLLSFSFLPFSTTPRILALASAYALCFSSSDISMSF